MCAEFFGFPRDKLYKEIYSVGYNEFLDAVKALKVTLLEEFPESSEEVERGCDTLLSEYEKRYDGEWFGKFAQYCSKNIFQVPRHVPVYAPELEDRETNEHAADHVKELKHRIMATEFLNSKLMETISSIDHEIASRLELVERIKEMREKAEVVKRGLELEAELTSLTQPLT